MGHEKKLILGAHKFSDLSVARAAADFAKNTNTIVRRACRGDRIVTTWVRVNDDAINSAKVTWRDELWQWCWGVPRMTRHGASTRGPWGQSEKKEDPGRLVPGWAPLANRPRKKKKKKKDRSLITRNRLDPWYVKADYIKDDLKYT